jgi:hypothetical protein
MVFIFTQTTALRITADIIGEGLERKFGGDWKNGKDC